MKTIAYRHFHQALEQARESGYDEAVLLNRYGHLVEGSRSNIFFLKNGALYTPSLSCGCLDGITRRIVLQLARKEKVPCCIVRATLAQLLAADEAFMTNSLVEVVPLLSVNDRPIGPGQRGPTTKVLQELYRRFVNNSQ